MNEEIKKIYDYVCQQEDIQDKILESSPHPMVQHGASTASTAYWSIKNFIEVNFKK